MDRIPIYADKENLVEIFSIDPDSLHYQGMKQFITKESKLIINDTEENLTELGYLEHIAKSLTSGDAQYEYIDALHAAFLQPTFKTNLQDRFTNKGSVLFSVDTARVAMAKASNGILMSGVAEEYLVYDQLNFNKNFFRASKILTIGKEFVDYTSLQNHILPFSEIIINEPYLFVPERRDFNLQRYLDNNFIALANVLFANTANKVNIVFCTFINEQNQHESHWYDLATKSFKPLYDYIKAYLNNKLGGARYKLWLVVSPQAYNARHDRYILTNYQYLECGAGLTYFDDRGNFINRGEAMHMYTTMHDEARQSLIPSILDKIQTKVIDNLKASKPERIFGADQGNSYLLKF